MTIDFLPQVVTKQAHDTARPYIRTSDSAGGIPDTQPPHLDRRRTESFGSVRVAAALNPDGRLTLLSNRFTPTTPPRQDLDDIYTGFDMPHGPPIDATRTSELRTLLDECGFTVEERAETEERQYTTDDRLNMVFTFSNRLGLEPDSRTLLRSRLRKRSGPTGVATRNDALATVCALRS